MIISSMTRDALGLIKHKNLILFKVITAFSFGTSLTADNSNKQVE
jgi:hypothetical protein